MKILYSFCLSLLVVLTSFAQEKVLLYPNGCSENFEITEAEAFLRNDFVINISEPRFYAYPASKDKATGTAVLICPGGGYSGVSVIKEGEEIAKWFNSLGISAFVLYYRMPSGHYKIPMKDAQTALEIIKSRAKEWNIKKNKVGIMGFSAGGHLASTVGTHFKSKKERPAFMILAYPVVTMKKEFTHGGSRKNLLGSNPTEELINLFSNELQVTKKTPSTFILHAKDDKVVPIANSENFYNALKTNKVPTELQIYDLGGHGFGLRKSGIPADNWDKVLENWLKKEKLIK